MAYCAFDQLQSLYSLGLLERLCTRAGDADAIAPPDIEARCLLALESSAGFMDAYIVSVYPVPVSTTISGTLATLRNCNGALAVSELVLQRGYVVGSEDEQLVRSARNTWIDWLASIRNGKTQLPGVSSESAAADQSVGRDSFYISSDPAWFPPSDRFC